MRRSLRYSLALHLLALALVLWLVPRRAKIPQVSSVAEVPIEFAPVPTVAKSTAKNKSFAKAKGSAASARSREIHLGPAHVSDLFSDYSSEYSHGRPARARTAGQDGYDFGRSMDVETEARSYPFFEALWRKVDAVTRYPQDLAKRRIEGSVTVHLVVDKRGVFTGKIVRIDSDDAYLKAYVTALLVHVLREPLARNLWSDRAETILVTTFNFKTFTSSHNVPLVNISDHFKNELTFRRQAYVDPKLNDAIEKFLTRYMPPIIPIPGGFYIDFYRAYQLIKNMKEQPPDPDAMREVRVEQMKEAWEGVIHKTGVD